MKKIMAVIPIVLMFMLFDGSSAQSVIVLDGSSSSSYVVEDGSSGSVSFKFVSVDGSSGSVYSLYQFLTH